ncbi:MAG: sulfatase-like hydrolase/transferase [Paludibacteraceae bacterium]|nr:sulfatase-like hydrolase/transferase [Paludibacteraceae bacterium]
MLFHWVIYHNILFSSLWKAPVAFFAFWGGKIVPVFFLGAFVFITKRHYWTIVINLLFDIWCIANLFYYKANGFFLTFEMIFMADNMRGFWKSLYAYLGWDIILPFILTLFYILIGKTLRIFKSNYKTQFLGTILILITLLGACANNYLYQKITYDKHGKPNKGQLIEQNTKIQYKYCYPFGNLYKDIIVSTWMDKGDWWISEYIKNYSILSYIPAMLLYEVFYIEQDTKNIIEISEETKTQIEKHINNKNDDIKKVINTGNMIYILVESLESWTLDSINNQLYLPHLTNFAKLNHVFYANHINVQVKHGVSADGQMIGMTGLLPISSGATCKLYGDNVYPNFAHFYTNSAIINPTRGVWQQSITTKSYEFKELIEPKGIEHWHDEIVINNVLDFALSSDTNFCVLGITIDSHIPFTFGIEHTTHHVKNMPPIMSAYLNCLHYTDSCIGVLIDSVLNSPLADNTTIVITGDHTIFRDENSFSDMTKYAQDNGINFRAGHTFTPLIIYSPQIDGNIQITDTCYQMDIFPTILHLIGGEDYYWHGFGVNLLDSVARNNRPISEEDAFILSDKMIRANYFATHIDK